MLKRDNIRYELDEIDVIKERELFLAKEVSEKINAELLTYNMCFDENDVDVVAGFICEEKEK